MKLHVDAEGDEGDLVLALEIISKQIEEGFTSGLDSGDERSYSYELTD
jgi:hypothetical protein